MAFKLAEAYVQLSQKGLSGVQGAIVGIGRRLTALLNPISAVTAGLGAIGAALTVRGMLSAFAAQEDAEQRLEQVVRATGGAAGYTADQLKRMASDLQEVTRFGDETTLQAQAMLLTFKSIRGETFRRTLESAMDLSTVFRQDLQSSILQLGKALEDPERGLTALRRVGVSFSEQQETVIKSLVQTGRLAEAQSMILDAIAGQVGGSARAAAGTTAGIWQQFKNAFGDVMEEIGGIIIETFDLKNVIGNMVEFAQNFKANYGETIKNVLLWVRDAAVWVWDAIMGLVDWIKQLWEAHGPLIVRLLKAAAIFFIIVKAVSMVTAVVSALGAAIAFLTSPIGIAMVAIMAFAALFGETFDEIFGMIVEFVRNWDIYLKLAWEGWKLWLSNLWERIKTLFVNAGRIVGWFFSNFGRIAETSVHNIGKLFSNLWHNIKEGAKWAWGKITGADYKPMFKSLMEGMEDIYANFPEMAKAAVRETTPEIERLNRELIRRQNARFAAKPKPKTKAEEAAEQLFQPRPGPRPQIGGPSAGGVAAAKPLAGTFGYSALVQKMQDAAFKAMEKKDADAARTARATEQLNQAAQGEGIAVRPARGGGMGQLAQIGAAWG